MVSACRIFPQILLLISLSKSEELCGEEKSVTVVKTLADSLGINSFIFVQGQHDAGVFDKIRSFSKGGLLSAVTNPSQLEAIMNDNRRKRKFFERRTVLVTKEELNFTKAFEKLSGIHTVTWAVMKSPGDIQTPYVPFDANFFVLFCTSKAVNLTKAYHIKPGLRLTVKSIRKRPEEGSEGFFEVDDIPNVHFENVTMNLLFLSDKKECKNRTHVLHKIECFQQEIVEIIAERLHMRINRIKCPEMLYPYNYPNGSLSDMFLILRRREADVSSGSYIVSNSRLINYDFVWPVYTTKSMMYIKYESIKSKWRAYLRPIESRVWTAIVSWIILTGILLQLFEESRRRNFQFTFSLLLEFIKSVFRSLQVFCNQGLHNVPQWTSNRIVYLLSFILCVALYEAYCAFLISSLTVTIPNIPFRDLDEFLGDGTYRMLTLKKGFHNFFVRKTLTEYGYNAEDILHDELDLPDTPQGGIDVLCTTEKITYVEFRENIVRSEIRCKLLELPKSIFRQGIGLGLPKNSPYKEILYQHVNALRASGILHRMNRHLLSYVTLQERETSNEDFIHVSFWHVVSIFSVMGSGTLLSIIIFLLEICYGFKNKPKISYEKTGRRRTLKTKYLNRKYFRCDDMQVHFID